MSNMLDYIRVDFSLKQIETPPGSSTNLLVVFFAIYVEKRHSSCFLCAAGKYNTKEGQTNEASCLLCAAGKYDTEEGQPSCFLCVLKVSNSLRIQIKKKFYWGAAEDDRPFKSREAAGNVDMFEIDNLTSFQPVSKLELTCRLLLEDALRSNLGLFFDDVSAFGLASVHKLSRLEESIL